MNHPMPRRGQPMVALAVVLTVWVAARVLIGGLMSQSGELPSVIIAPARITPQSVAVLQDNPTEGQGIHLAIPQVQAPHSQPWPGMVAPRPAARHGAGDRPARMGAVSSKSRVEVAASTAPSSVPYVSPDAKPRGRRWSADAWMMLRDGGGSSPITGPARATYGASQLGAVVRYRLAPDSGYRPTAYLRGTAALVHPHDREVAAGLSARPIPRVPLTVAAELRVGDINSTMRVRPAIMAVTELLPRKLPLHLLGEAYAQAGYVGGRGATAFIDGQLRIDRGIARIGRAELRAGGGAWGGAQKDASRLDIGPAVTLGVSVNDIVFARVTADWRFRVAGNAVPESGPALTLSAAF